MSVACDVSRRAMLAGTAAAGVALAGMAGAAKAEENQWDEQTDLLVIGSGCGIFSAVTAKKNDIDCIVLEKEEYMYGGSTFLSSGGQWAPRNYPGAALQTEEEKELDSTENLMAFMDGLQYRGTQAYGDGMLERMFENIAIEYDYVVNTLGFPWGDFTWPMHDYQSVEGSNIHRNTGVGDMWVATRAFIDTLGLDIRFGTTATKLLTDEAGAVVGVQAVDAQGNTVRFGAKKVIVAAGPFDRNSDMVNAYLRVPLEGSVIGEGCTGDGIRMCQELGADMANMTHFIATPVVLPSPNNEEGFFANIDETDAGSARMYPHMIMVNKCGMRIGSESDFYGAIGDAMMNNHTWAGRQYSNRRVTGVFDSTYIANYGWPLAPRWDKESMPAHVREYATLEELAEGEGIVAPERFLEEVERFNRFCDDGVDRDFHRGEGAYDSPEIEASVASFGAIPAIQAAEPDLKNPELGRIETAPFYAVTYGVGSYSTCGGMKVDKYNRVCRNGEPIENLYAVGANAAFNYGTGGMGVGWGCWCAINAMNHAYDLGIY